MKLFLSFLKVPVEISRDHLGCYTGWTQRNNKELKLVIGGGCVGGKELLNDLQFGEKLDNSYNNYVNPFFLVDILTKDGMFFFLNYYRDDIKKVFDRYVNLVDYHKSMLEKAENTLKQINAELNTLESLN